jgi:hypothetical protein
MEQIRQMQETAIRLRDDAREAEQAYYREKMLQTARDLEMHAAELKALKGASVTPPNEASESSWSHK